MKRGIDVSSNNGIINWDIVKNNIDFAIIRCGYGDDIYSQDDSQYSRNISECERLNIPYGVYLYSYALNLNEAKSEASHALRLLNKVGKNFKYGIWLDMEDADGYKRNHGFPSNDMLVNICKTFCDTLISKGYKSGIYASLSWLNGYLNNSSLDKYPKWVAQWNNKCTYNKPYEIWQYTNNLIINIKRFDGNYLYNESPSPSPSPKEGIVLNFQKYLNNTYNFNLSVDNIFGNDTLKHSIMALQIEFNNQLHSGLIVDGIFGVATYRACPNLYVGMSGNITKLVQYMLEVKGYSVGSYGIDGIYGNGTANAVRQFQANNGLAVDGICGSNTFKRLFK